ncbi:MAG: ATP-dependent DNA helicase RecQ [Gammaproteobacteria bacterium (ex Lamellibrachia satsuma)]|nr:MAG: DNA helicase RecQ [Gammaproteobacteria bacterium (ex Lamellibrachia satsuma)]RRS32754.1 MAG: ATP-dependent DNA helicase RecQ [Gammaproteobacteria bacterium (ex Lamellibrachia satsuma)]RRS36218.1 MAG: ATP-dependent DNA helicase RecQ [Gammaproteobacteria bacterium (ex Lamellibrachia satsuma)]
MHRALQILNNTFGYETFRHNQSDIIATLLEGQDALALMPTGGGKSLCYQIPALIRPGVGVVISPLIALMQDQVDALTQLGLNAAFLNSTLDIGSIRATEQALLAGELDLLYIAPERLLNERTLSLLEQVPLALFAIDEAHCVSQWGHDFRKDYQRLSILQERFPCVPRIALTATADERTRHEIIEQLGLQSAAIFINSFDRPNIRYALAEGQNAKEALWQLLMREHPNDAGIVYCLSRKRVEQIADWLSTKGRKALPYHAGLSDAERRNNQSRFLREDGVIIVATIAFGMGIDKPDVRFVAHLNLPKSVEAYYQETGRAGRDGEPANAWMAYGLQDVITLRQFTQSSDSEDQFKRVAHHKLEAMLGLCELTGCRRQALLAYFGETLPEPCGNCDNCLLPPETWDAQEAARKALSCVYRTGQRFGVNYVVDVLRGKEDDRIQRFGHDRLSTFGIGADLSISEWRSLFRQLIAQGYLDIDVAGHGSLRLTEKSRPLLRGEQGLMLRRQRKVEKEKSKRERKLSGLRAFDRSLFESLRVLRLELAEAQGVPPYVIFHDATLTELARRRPASLHEMAAISGVGESKLARYGQQFLLHIREYPLPDMLRNNLSDTVNETLYLFNNGKDAQRIAQERELKLTTVYSHFAEALEVGLLDITDVLPVEAEEYTEIVRLMEHLDVCEEGRLKPLYEALDGAWDYGILRCVLAAECG